MYKKGIIKITTPRCQQAIDENDDYCDEGYDDSHKHGIHDARGEYAGAGIVYLPHSCQEWVIGGKKEVETLICDLQSVLSQLRQVQ